MKSDEATIDKIWNSATSVPIEYFQLPEELRLAGPDIYSGCGIWLVEHSTASAPKIIFEEIQFIEIYARTDDQALSIFASENFFRCLFHTAQYQSDGTIVHIRRNGRELERMLAGQKIGVRAFLNEEAALDYAKSIVKEAQQNIDHFVSKYGDL